jgi:hypothetical protein
MLGENGQSRARKIAIDIFPVHYKGQQQGVILNLHAYTKRSEPTLVHIPVPFQLLNAPQITD